MANLVKIAEELEYVPKPQLVEMARSADSRFPIYMVLSEIQRRTHMEKIYNVAREEQPTQTVAEGRVNEFEQSQGLAGAGADQLALANTPPTELAPASPMQEVAGGGRIRYQTGGYTDLPDTNVDPYGNVVTAGIPGLSDEERRRREELIGTSIVDSSLIQAESGGNPDALLGHSQDDFDWYPSNQTIGENIEFANPDGDYAAFSREYLGGENYSTPMGLYQITGTTLRDIVDRFGDDIGVDLDTPFTPDVQQRLADAYLSGHVLREGQTPEERRESFKRAWAAADNFSDDQIDTLIASMSERDLERRAGEAYSSARGVTLDRDSLSAIERQQAFIEGRTGGLKDWARERYFGDDDKFNYGNAAMDALLFVPGVGLVGAAGLKGAAHLARAGYGAYKAGKFGAAARSVGRGARSTVMKPNPAVVHGPGFTMRPPGAPTHLFSPIRAGITGAGIVGAHTLASYLSDKGDGLIGGGGANDEDDDVGDVKVDLPREGDVKSVLDQAEGLDIARLGGIIMGAKNMSELGTGIAGLAEGIQERRAAEKLSTAQMGLLEAQTAKYESEVANLEKTELMQLMGVLQDAIRDAGPLERPELFLQFSAALNRYNQLTGGGVDGTEGDRRMEGLATFGEEPPRVGAPSASPIDDPTMIRREETDGWAGIWKSLQKSGRQYAEDVHSGASPYLK